MPSGTRHGSNQATAARAAGSASGLAATLAGVPLVLTLSGASAPVMDWARAMGSHLAHPGTIPALLGRPIGDDVVAGAATALAWLAWAWLVLCVAVELAARARGVPARSLPGSRRLQSVVTLLVGASLSLLPPVRHGATTVTVTAATVTARTTDALVLPGGDTTPALAGQRGAAWSPSPGAPSPGAPAPTAERTYTVRRGDTLWSIAEEQLQSPLRWREIAALNIGRPEPGGLAFEHAGWIFPGWELVLPPDTVPADPASASASASTSPSGVVDLRSRAWSRSGDRNSPAVAAGRSRAARRPPAAGRSRATATPAPATGTGAPAAAAAESIGHHPDRAPGQRRRDSTGLRVSTPGPAGRYARDWNLPVEPIGFGLMSAGVVALLIRLRRVQQRHRPEGRRIVLPGPELAAVEQRLRVSADVAAADWVDVTLRLLTARARRMGEGRPKVVALRVLPTAVELVLDPDWAMRPPPAPFEAGRDGTSWFLPRAVEVLERFRNDPWTVGADPSCPALVTLGRGSLGDVLVDLQCVGSMAVTGPRAAGVLRSMAVELATASWSDQVDVSLVGFGGAGVGPVLAGLDRVRLFGSVPELIPQLERLQANRRDLMATSSYPTTWGTGSGRDFEARDLVVVLCSEASVSEDPPAAAELVRLADDGSSGIVAVCAGDVMGARWHVRAGDEPIVVEAGALREKALWPQHLDAADAVGIASLVQVAGRLEGVTPTDPPYDRLNAAPLADRQPSAAGVLPLSILDDLDDDLIDLSDLDTPATAHPDPDSAAGHIGTETESNDPDVDPDPRTPATGTPATAIRAAPTATDLDPGPAPGQVEVLVLGPVSVRGAARPFTRAWALDLVVFLAMHRDGATSEQWSTALWPDRTPASSSMHSTVSSARRSLGTDAQDNDHLPRGHGRLALGPGVTSDWARFEELAASEDPEDWGRALGLVRGRPFDGLRAVDWTVLQGVSANIDASVVDVAERFARWCTAQGRPADAEWAARQGLRVSPYDERLYRALLRAADAAGNPAGVEAVMAELVTLVAEDVEPHDAVHPETFDLYRKLSRRRFRTAG